MDGIETGLAPHAYEVRTTARSMWFLCACLAAPILQSSLSDGFSSLLIAAVAVSSAAAAELLLDVRNSQSSIGIADGSSVVTALVLTLMLPNGIHPGIAAAGAVFAVVVVKRGFGGLGSNWLNPAVGSWLFLRACWPGAFDSALASSPLSALSAAVSKGLGDPSGSPLAVLKIAGLKPSPADGAATSWLNDTILSPFGAELPGGYLDLFNPVHAGAIGDRGLLLLLFATIVLIALRIVRWAIPAVFVAAYLCAVFVLGGLRFGGGLFRGDMLFSLLSGSLVLSAFVLVADPATGAKTKGGSLLVAALAGLFAFWFRFYGSDPYGALLALPAANIAAVLLRLAEHRFLYVQRTKQ